MIFDGVSFFRDFNITYYTQSKNASQGWYSLRCPFHGDHADHMGFNPQSGALSCWICGKKGPIDYIKAVLGIPKPEAFSLYRKYLTHNSYSAMGKIKKKAQGSSILLPGKEFTLTEQKYLNKRGLNEKHCEVYDLRSGGQDVVWAYRIVFPIYNNGVIVSVTGRGISSSCEPKYWTLPLDKELIHHKHIFYGLDLVNETVVVVEGPIDAVRGGPGFIACFGVNMSDEQLCSLLLFKKVLFLKDSDAAGDKFTEQAYKLAALGGKDIEVIDMDNGFKDVGAMSDGAIHDLRRELGLDE
jgi:DNA primase